MNKVEVLVSLGSVLLGSGIITLIFLKMRSMFQRKVERALNNIFARVAGDKKSRSGRPFDLASFAQWMDNTIDVVREMEDNLGDPKDFPLCSFATAVNDLKQKVDSLRKDVDVPSGLKMLYQRVTELEKSDPRLDERMAVIEKNFDTIAFAEISHNEMGVPVGCKNEPITITLARLCKRVRELETKPVSTDAFSHLCERVKRIENEDTEARMRSSDSYIDSLADRMAKLENVPKPTSYALDIAEGEINQIKEHLAHIEQKLAAVGDLVNQPQIATEVDREILTRLNSLNQDVESLKRERSFLAHRPIVFGRPPSGVGVISHDKAYEDLRKTFLKKGDIPPMPDLRAFKGDLRGISESVKKDNDKV